MHYNLFLSALAHKVYLLFCYSRNKACNVYETEVRTNGIHRLVNDTSLNTDGLETRR